MKPAEVVPGEAVRAFLNRHRDILVGLGLLALTLAVYLPYALKAGWYYDDWSLASHFKDAGSGWSDQFHQCTSTIPAGRAVSCLYLVTEYHLFTDHRSLYALASMAFLFAMAGLTYLILCRARLPWPWAAVIAGLLVVFPASDSTRLWEAASYGQYVIVLELIGVLLALKALSMKSGWVRWVLHVISFLLMVLAIDTYEIALPLVALNGFVYWAAYRDRAAIRRGLVDLGLAIVFVIYRLVIDPPESEGFVEHRTISGNVTRAWHLIEAAWSTWHEVFIPGSAAPIVLVAFLVIAAAGAVADADLRRRLRPWAALLMAGLVLAVAATLVFQTANDLYLPQVGSLFNRVVLPGSIPYICVFTALLGIGFELVRRITARTWLAIVAVGVVGLVSVWHQLRISSTHKEHWEASWVEQQAALPGYEAAVRNLPPRSRLVGFGVPTWEPEFVPIFAAPWDLLGALRYRTDARIARASPMTALDPTPCKADGVVPEASVLRYNVPGAPLFFIDAISGRAVRVDSQAACERMIAKWGVPTYLLP